jgi:hypothetical protein
MGAMAISASPTPTPPPSTSDWEGAAFLECERAHWGVTATKEELVFETFGLGLPAYYQRLYRLCRTREALSYDAHLVRTILDAADRAVTRRMSEPGGGS